MSLRYIRDYYGVPAARGGQITYDAGSVGQPPFLGVIIGARGAYLRVRLDGEKRAITLHPTWAIKYLTPKNDVL